MNNGFLFPLKKIKQNKNSNLISSSRYYIGSCKKKYFNLKILIIK